MAAAETGLLHAAPRRGRLAEREQVVVDRDGSGVQLLREPPRRAARACPARSGEAERGVVREPDSFVERIHRHDGQERPERLVAHRVHRVVDAGEDGRGKPPPFRPRALPSHENLRAFRDRVLEMRFDEIPLPGGREGAHVGRRRERITEPEHLRPRHDLREQLGGDFLHDVDALDGAAGLARVHERAPDEPRGRPVEIRVGRDHGGVLAPELEDDAREVLRGALHDLDAGRDGAREEDLGDPGVFDEDVRVVAARRHDVHDAGRQARATAQVPDGQPGQRRGGRGLQDHRVARREAGRDLDEGDAEREVPRRHDRDDAERLEAGAPLLVREEDLRVVDGPLGKQRARMPREIPERVRRGHDVDGAGFADGLPLFRRDEARDVFVRAANFLEQPREVALPAGDRRLRPGAERLLRRGDGHLDLPGAGADDVRERLLRRRVHGRETRARLHVLAVDDRRVRERKRRLQIMAPRVMASFFVRQNATRRWT